ncbi:MAG TPA: hypothetical protein VNZ64_15965 [Candidatus Acidoferrum sp.]|nr:hypothetical protein [Candidatus Acidoferrum sp.]
MAKTKTPVVSFAASAALIMLLFTSTSEAWPLGRTTFRLDAPFVGTNGVHSLTATNMDSLVTVAAWADTAATVPANLYQWWWILGVDSGVGNGALIDGTESMTLDFDKSVGAAMIYFLYTGGTGGTTNNLARLSISGFASDPGASAVTYNTPRISNISYASGTVSFDYLLDNGNDFGQLMLSNPAASAGQTLKITGAVSPNGDATSWYAALYGVDVEEAYAGPHVSPVSIPHNITNSYTSPDGKVVIRGYVDRNAVTLGNLGRYQDECIGVYGGPGGNVVDTNESITIQLATRIGLSRLDSVYSAGDVTISGFASDPGFADPSRGTLSANYVAGALTFTMADGGVHAFYFTNRAASAGHTLRINVAVSPGNQFGIARIDYVNAQTLIGPDIPSNVAASYATPDGLLALNGFSDTPGTVPANLYENVDWFGVAGGNNTEAIDGTESLNCQFSANAGLSGIGTRYTSGQVIISGFSSDPGFADPSGIASDATYSAGALSYAFNAPHAPELVVRFNNLSASLGRTLSVHTDGNSGSQIALTRINYAVGPVALSVAHIGGDVVLTWPAGTLQQSTTASGNYSDVNGATSPFTNAVAQPQQYFRVKVQ